MGNTNNQYIPLFTGINKDSTQMVRDAFFKNIRKLDISESYIIEEIENDHEMTIEDLLDILELEAMDSPELKKFIFAVRLNLKKSQISKQKPINDSEVNDDFDSLEAVE